MFEMRAMRATRDRCRPAAIGRVAIAVALLLGAAAPAAADLSHWIQITGATQGQFPGGGDSEPFVGFAQGLAYHHLIERVTSGGPTQHETVISTIRMDEPLIPNLMDALQNDESLAVSFTFRRPSPQGAEETYAVISLAGARVVSLEPLSTDDQDPGLTAYKATVRVRFSYASITFDNVPSATTATLVNGGS